MTRAALATIALTLIAPLGAAPFTTGCSDGDGTPADGAVDGGGCALDMGPAESVPDPDLTTPRWAFRPWISKDISDRADTFAFVDGFRDRDIPVGVVVLDSPWETNYNTFVPNPDRYPDFADMVSQLHGMDVRIVLWITQMHNLSSFDAESTGDRYEGPAEDHQAALDCDFFVNDGVHYGWWKGNGAGLDFFDPKALRWWRSLQDPLYEMGIDGWKLDFGDSYITANTVRTEQGEVPHQEYSEAYYRDFYAYGASRRGGPEELVTMVRGYDESYQFEGRFFARPEHAPVVWMGDNTRDWAGLVDALDHTFRSAQAGYVVLGSDVGGYLDVSDQGIESIPFDPEVFNRWVAVGGLSPFMQLHGRANLVPWDLPEPTTPEQNATTTDNYRYWAKLHTQLIPFWYSLAEEAYAGDEGIVRPVGADESAWAGDWRYMLGEAFLVAPLFEPGGVRDVALPGDAGTEWFDWWAPEAEPLAGGQTLPDYDASDWQRIPVFVRRGAIVPMDVSDDTTGLGTAGSAGHLTVLVWPGAEARTFTLHDEGGGTTDITAGGDEVSLTRTAQPTLLRVWRASPPSEVLVNDSVTTKRDSRDALDDASDGWWWEPATRSAWVKVPESTQPQTVVFQ